MSNFSWIETGLRGSSRRDDAIGLSCKTRKDGSRTLTVTFYSDFAEQMGLSPGDRMLVGVDEEGGKLGLLFGERGNILKDSRTKEEQANDEPANLLYAVRVSEQQLPEFALHRIKKDAIEQDNNLLTFDAPFAMKDEVALAA